MDSTIQGENVHVSITVGDVRVQFSGSADAVMTSVINFVSKQLPSIDLAKRISLNYSVTELIETYSDLVKITPEGPRIINDTQIKLSDKELIALQLVASRIAKELGKIADDALQVSDIQQATALNPKSASSRISELVKSGMVSRDSNEQGKYRITTSGIHWLNSVIAKKPNSQRPTK
jgi:predicted transcriptional regulator